MEFLSKSQIKQLITKHETDINGLLLDNIIKEVYQFKAFYKYENRIKKYILNLNTDDTEVAYNECRFLWGLANFKELHPAAVKYQLM